MSMGRRKRRQETLFVATADLARSAGHPFYRKLNELLAEAEFDRWIEGRCEPYYEAADQPGRESIPPGTFFRMLLVGYFEGIDSQRGIAWRCGDSLSLREFLNYAPQEATPDHSTLSYTRKRLPPEVFDEMFQFVLKLADQKRLIGGKTVGVDSTTLEANAAMKSILRRDTGEDWKQYVVRLMKEEGRIDAKHEPTDEEIRRFDKKPQEQEGLERRLGFARRSRGPDHATERRSDASGVQGRARRRLGERSDLGGRNSSCRPRRCADALRQRLDSPREFAASRGRDGDRRGGGRQRLSLGRDVGVVRRPRAANLHPRTEACARSHLDRQNAGTATSRVREPTTDEAGQR